MPLLGKISDYPFTYYRMNRVCQSILLLKKRRQYFYVNISEWVFLKIAPSFESTLSKLCYFLNCDQLKMPVTLMMIMIIILFIIYRWLHQWDTAGELSMETWKIFHLFTVLNCEIIFNTLHDHVISSSYENKQLFLVWQSYIVNNYCWFNWTTIKFYCWAWRHQSGNRPIPWQCLKEVEERCFLIQNWT